MIRIITLGEALGVLPVHPDLSVALVAARYVDARDAFMGMVNGFRLDERDGATVRCGVGNERVEWPNGSKLLVLACTPNSARGMQLDAALVLGRTELPAEWAPCFQDARWPA